jgi:hypothetical protein
MSFVRGCAFLLLSACTALISGDDSGSGGRGGSGGSGGGGTGGGSADVCGPSTCSTGCCAGNACFHGGKIGGVPCVDVCDGGDIGAPCAQDSDCCGGLSPFCHKTEIQLLPGAPHPTSGAPYPGGYCSSRCTSTECGAGNRCEIKGGPFGEALNLCLHSCASTADCRSGYFCYGAPTGVCVPADAAGTGPVLFDAGPPPTLIGQDCPQDSDCRAQTAYGYCLHTAGFGTGECVADCTMTVDDTWCSGGQTPANNHCDGVAVADRDAGGVYVAWRCKQGCTMPSDCKTGYHCTADGLGDNVCEPNCDNASTACPSMECFTSWGCVALTCSALTHGCH